jgi:hypothetical protein
VTTFLVESYEPRGRAHDPAELEARARAAARACGGRYIRSILTPDDELCLCMFDAPSRDELEQAALAAGFSAVHVSVASELADDKAAER